MKATFTNGRGDTAVVVDWSVGDHRRTGVTLRKQGGTGRPVAMQNHPLDGAEAGARFAQLCDKMQADGWTRADAGRSTGRGTTSLPLAALDALKPEAAPDATQGALDATQPEATDAKPRGRK